MPSISRKDSNDSALDLRKSLGKFATGVTVITCRDAEGRHFGITANSFTSVSLSPPLVLWNIARISSSLEAFLEAEVFVVNVLAEHQHGLASHFARSEPSIFDGVEFSEAPGGAAVLPDTLATIECRLHQVYEAGDHFIVVGEVLRHDCREGDPLLFIGGRYAACTRDP